MSSSFPNGISSMKLIVSNFEQEISSASLGNNSIQITNENIKNAFNNSPAGTIFNPSISVTYNDSAFPSVTQVTTPTVIPNYVPRIPLPPLSLLANGFTIKYNDDPADVPDSTAKFIQANPRGTGMEWFAVVKQDMKVAMTNYAKGINNAPVNALNFDGVNDGINYGLPALMTGSTGTQFRTTSTLECWFKHPGAPQDIYPTLMARNYSGGNTDQSVFGLDMYNNKVRIFVQTMSGASYIESINTYADSTWHHAAVSYNGQIGELKLYIDGVLDSSYANAALGLLSDSTNSLTRSVMAIGVRVAPELEQQLERLARSMGKSRSACVREAIAQYVQRFSNNDEARRQSALIAEHSGKPNWSERLPDWTDWTA